MMDLRVDLFQRRLRVRRIHYSLKSCASAWVVLLFEELLYLLIHFFESRECVEKDAPFVVIEYGLILVGVFVQSVRMLSKTLHALLKGAG